MLLRYANQVGIRIIDKDAVDIVVEKAKGLPVYIWQVIRELRIKRKPLTYEFATRIPQGMLEYIDDILWRILDTNKERYEILITLLTMTDLKHYAILQDVYNYLFLTAKEERANKKLKLEDITFSELFNKITRYLVKDIMTQTFRLPHDSWADVLKGKSNGPMGSEITQVNTIYPKERRRELLEIAIVRAWNNSIKYADEKTIENFKRFVKLNFEERYMKDLIIKEKLRVPNIIELDARKRMVNNEYDNIEKRKRAPQPPHERDPKRLPEEEET